MNKTKTAVVGSGRFQGIHHGHALLVNGVVAHAQKIGADHYVYPTRTQDNDKNPIPHNEKVGYMRQMFPNANIVSDPEVRNPIEAVKKLSRQGYRHVKLVAGQDRIPQFQASIGAYVKKKTDKDFDPKKHIDLDSFEVVSAGDRDPDAEGVQGASGTKMREWVRNGDFESFAKATPSSKASVVRGLFNSMRKGMTPKKKKTLAENFGTDDVPDEVKKFADYAKSKLQIKELPKMRCKDKNDSFNSFAAYNPHDKELTIEVKNRHPMDIFRSVAHELVHHKQNEKGLLGKDVEAEGATGSTIENEANAEAGVVMRCFAKDNPNAFAKSELMEQYLLSEGINDPGKLKAIFLAGGPGSGKDYVMNSVLQGEGLREINSDVAFEFLMKKNGLDMEMPDSETVERDIVRKRAKGVTRKQQAAYLKGRLGVIINGTADDVEKIKAIKQQLEYGGYETMMVFVNTSNEVSRQRNVERGKAGGRKVPDGTDKQGVPDNSKDIRSQKWLDAQKNMGELQKIFGNQSFVVLDNSVDIRKTDPETKENVLTNFNRVKRMAQQFVRSENKNPKAKKWIDQEASRRGITSYQEPKRYKTISQIRQSAPVHNADVPDNSVMAQARRLGLSYFGFGRFGRKINGTNKVMFKEKGGRLERIMTEEKMGNPCWKGYKAYGMKKKNGKKVPNCVPVDEAFESFMEEKGNKADEREIGTKSLRDVYASMTPGQEHIPQEGIGPETPLEIKGVFSTPALSESIVAWMHNERTQQKFQSKYGSLWEDKIVEAAISLEESGCGCEHKRMPKSIKQLKETISKEGNNFVVRSKTGKNLGKSDSKAGAIKRLRQVEYFKHMKEEQLNERGSDSKGLYRSTESGAGLTAKGAKHFGVKTAVTEPNPGPKRKARRKSFCARMSGMPGPMKDEKGRPTRKAASLRRWRCRT